MYVRCDTYLVRRITSTWNTTALVPRAVCCLDYALLCSEKMSVRSSWKQKCTVPCRRKKKVPSLPVVEEIMYRPVPSWKIICTVPSRRAKKYIPSRPVVTFFIYRPVPSWNKTIIVLYRPVPTGKFTHTVPSHPGICNFHYFIVPSRPVFTFFPAKHDKTAASRPVSNITSHEKPCLLAPTFTSASV